MKNMIKFNTLFLTPDPVSEVAVSIKSWKPQPQTVTTRKNFSSHKSTLYQKKLVDHLIVQEPDSTLQNFYILNLPKSKAFQSKQDLLQIKIFHLMTFKITIKLTARILPNFYKVCIFWGIYLFLHTQVKNPKYSSGIEKGKTTS